MLSLSERLYWADRRLPEPSIEPPPDPADDDETWSSGLDYWCEGSEEDEDGE